MVLIGQTIQMLIYILLLILISFLKKQNLHVKVHPSTSMWVDVQKFKQDKEKLTSHRWASNNSIFAKIGMDYSYIAKQIAKNGEPGVLWLENSQAFSRMIDSPDYKDKKVAGVNP